MASEGSYSAVWMPPATGTYLVRAKWNGNYTFLGATKIVNLAVTAFEEQRVFSVESNSTVSDISFKTENLKLSFTVSGPNGTRGYVRVTVAKSLVNNINDAKVYLNNEEINYTAISSHDNIRPQVNAEHNVLH